MLKLLIPSFLVPSFFLSKRKHLTFFFKSFWFLVFDISKQGIPPIILQNISKSSLHFCFVLYKRNVLSLKFFNSIFSSTNFLPPLKCLPFTFFFQYLLYYGRVKFSH